MTEESNAAPSHKPGRLQTDGAVAGVHRLPERRGGRA